MEAKQTFVVAREKWMRGGSSDTALLTLDGMRCCLGFVAAQCGIADDRITTIAEPLDIDDALGLVPDENAKHPLVELSRELDDDGYCSVSAQNTELSGDAIEINDSPSIDDAEREKRLSAAFTKHGYAIEFVDTREQLEARLAELRATPLQRGEKGPGR